MSGEGHEAGSRGSEPVTITVVQSTHGPRRKGLRVRWRRPRTRKLPRPEWDHGLATKRIRPVRTPTKASAKHANGSTRCISHPSIRYGRRQALWTFLRTRNSKTHEGQDTRSPNADPPKHPSGCPNISPVGVCACTCVLRVNGAGHADGTRAGVYASCFVCVVTTCRGWARTSPRGKQLIHK